MLELIEHFRELRRILRSIYRRRFHPDGPPWGRLSSVNLIVTLYGCSFSEAERIDQQLAETRKQDYLDGY
jgi:hypothetical protein